MMTRQIPSTNFRQAAPAMPFNQHLLAGLQNQHSNQQPNLPAIPERAALDHHFRAQELANQVRLAQREEEAKRQQQLAAPGAPHTYPLPNPQAPRIVAMDSVTTVAYNRAIFGGSDVYTVNQPIVICNNEKRFVRILWGDGARGHEARWIGFVPSGWKMEHAIAQDPQVLGFFLKPKLCDRSAKTNKRACTGWVTLTIDCERRAIKATIDGWTLGKMFIPTWLMGRVMHPVAISEPGTPVRFDVCSTRDCEKVLRAGFDRWSLLENAPLDTFRCAHTLRNFEHEVIGMSMEVNFDEDTGDVLAVGEASEMAYISYSATDMGLGKDCDEVIPLVINDQHAFRAQERKLWDLFYANDRRPLDYLSERMAAVVRAVYEAKRRRCRREAQCAMTKLAHLRHVLFFLANRDLTMVTDANDRVRWFLMNTRTAGAHKEHTPDLCRLLVCLAVSDYEWEDVAVAFFSEALQRGLPEAMKLGEKRDLLWSGPNTCTLDDMLECVMRADKSLPEALVQVAVLNTVLKPVETFRRAGVTDDFAMLERVSAEELCCAIGGLSPDLRALVYEFSSRKDEVKKAVLRREGEHGVFTSGQWILVEAALNDPMRLRGMLFRARMLARCHGTCGVATPDMHAAADAAFELGKTADSFAAILDGFGLRMGPGAGENAVSDMLKAAIASCRRKNYVDDSKVPLAELPGFQGFVSARRVLRLGAAGADKMQRQARPEPCFPDEVLPNFCDTPSSAASDCSGTLTPAVLAPEGVSVGVTPGGELMDCTSTGSSHMLVAVTPVSGSSSPTTAAVPGAPAVQPAGTPTSSAGSASPGSQCGFGRAVQTTGPRGEASPRSAQEGPLPTYQTAGRPGIQVNVQAPPAAQQSRSVPLALRAGNSTPGWTVQPATPMYEQPQAMLAPGFTNQPSLTPGLANQHSLSPAYGMPPVTPGYGLTPMTPGAGVFAHGFQLASPATPHTPPGGLQQPSPGPTVAYLTSEGLHVPQLMYQPSSGSPYAATPGAVPQMIVGGAANPLHCIPQVSGGFGQIPQAYYNMPPVMQN